MHKAIAVLAVYGLLFLAAAGRADEGTAARFDGVWTTVVSCAAYEGAVPYSYEFPSTVKDSVLQGERGVRGAPGWLQLDGRILPDGSSKLSAHGLVGAERAAVGERARGTPYKYQIDATFTGNSGSGHRVKGRPCTVSFSRKTP